MSADLDQLQTFIGYRFKTPDLLAQALTHSSTGAEQNYERLEFLGDRVLGLVVSEILFGKFPDESEGDLAKRLASLVQGAFLAQIGRQMELGDFLNLSDAERGSGGSQNDHILADVVEAIIGAIYLDSSELAACRAFIEGQWGDAFYTMHKPPQHPKTALQEWLQAQGLPLPNYKIINQSGPDHAPVFEVELKIRGHQAVSAEGRSRQEAEKEAARLFMERLNNA
ncbi:MAG: ribonuclease III [Alphaproteobacteria bacterium]|nr:ribonuclease III [Alphaproteobacteria bacterium]MCD8526200.1 ribonuclease III [Alphaproteobacteria bacterium]MCD8570154.1 ribonuclease III [Alphaproteobacteria bacterium]